MKLVSNTSTIGWLVFPHKETFQSDSEQIAAQFIKVLFKEFCVLCHKYISHRDISGTPFDYSERQLDTCLMPALWKICNGYVMAEHPIKRHLWGDDYYGPGRIDYWCHYKGCTFLIEVKHSRWRGSLTEEAKHRWNVLTKYQLKTLIKSEVRENLSLGEMCIPIGLHFLSSKRCLLPKPQMNQNEILKDMKKELEAMYKAHLPLSRPCVPNYCCLYQPDNVEKKDSKEKRVAIVARINRAIYSKTDLW